MAHHGVVEPAKLIVVIDFGTTFSGFSYIHMDLVKHDPDNFLDNVEGREMWPFQDKVGAKPYFKTQTSLLYVEKDSRRGEFELKSWGWTAYSDQLELQKHPEGKPYHFITKFKLALAVSKKHVTDSYNLPEGFTVQRVVSDYLQQLSILIEVELQKKYGDHIGKKDIQWCLTVPAIWDNAARQEMRKCAEMAGLVAGPLNSHKGEASSHPVMIVLEPEAASVYCLHYLRRAHQADLPPRSKILVVDAGGGTVDLTFHEKVDSGSYGQQVKEISSSSGDLCGATFLDDAFHDFLGRRVSCYKEFVREHPSEVLRIKTVWESIKFCFDGSPDSSDAVLWLSAHMGNYWETYDREHDITPASNYDEITITLDEMRSIFDSVVDKIIDLIEDQFKEVGSEEEKSVTIMTVGGFSGSPYLMDRIRKSFESRVKSVINPTHPGKAVVTGAVVFGGLGKEVIISRVSRKTYGIVCTRDFHPKDPESKLVRGEDGRPKCTEVFHIYTRKGDAIPVNYSHKMQYAPLKRGTGTDVSDNCIEVEVFSSTETDPEFVTDEGCVKECTYSFPVPSRQAMTEVPRIEVSMFFGRTTIEVTAEAVNFQCEKVILPVLTLEAEA